MSEYIMAEEWFQEKSSSAALKLIRTTETTTEPDRSGQCPWDFCILTKSWVTFSHSSTLTGGTIRYQLYRYTDAITRQVKRLLSSNQLGYVGMKSAAAGFGIIFKGLTNGAPMDEDQERYFGRTLVNFFTESIPKTSASVTVFDSTFSSGLAARSLRVERWLNEDIVVHGTIHGGTVAAVDKEELVVQLENVMRSENEYFVQSLQYGSVISTPGIDTYFNSVKSISWSFTVTPDVAADWGSAEIDEPTTSLPTAFPTTGNSNTLSPTKSFSDGQDDEYDSPFSFGVGDSCPVTRSRYLEPHEVIPMITLFVLRGEANQIVYECRSSTVKSIFYFEYIPQHESTESPSISATNTVRP